MQTCAKQCCLLWWRSKCCCAPNRRLVTQMKASPFTAMLHSDGTAEVGAGEMAQPLRSLTVPEECRRPGFTAPHPPPQHPQGISQPPMTPFPRCPMPLFYLGGLMPAHGTHTNTQVHACTRTHTQINTFFENAKESGG